MFAFWPFDLRLDLEPITDGGDLAERDAGLRHAERPGVHSEKNDAFPAVTEFVQIDFMRRPGVIQRIVNVSDGMFELQAVGLYRQFTRRRDQLPAYFSFAHDESVL